MLQKLNGNLVATKGRGRNSLIDILSFERIEKSMNILGNGV
jgi:hypothetical protein